MSGGPLTWRWNNSLSEKEKLTQERTAFEILVNEMPTRAGIDPYNKLVDRVSDDNMIDVTKPSPID